MKPWLIVPAMCLLILGGWLATSGARPNPGPDPQAKSGGGEFPDAWYFYTVKRPAALRALEGKAAAELTVKDWIGSPQKLADLKGKVVVVDFWATWCPPCMRSLPHNVSLVNQNKNKGLVFIGVHDANRGSEKMAAVAKDKKLNYPLAVDDGGKSARAYSVSFWPTYVVIDRTGKVRAAGLEPDSVEKVVKKLLDEKDDQSSSGESKQKPPPTQPKK